MTTIVPIVEGHGEVQAAPELLRRMLIHHGAYALKVGKPIRQPRSSLLKEESFKATVALARSRPDCSAILVLFDADDEGPCIWGPRLLEWSKAELGNYPVYVVLAKREYEAWLIASLETMRGQRRIRHDAPPPPDAEAIRDAKGWLSEQMPKGVPYTETGDQAALTTFLDFRLAHQRSRSFRKLWKDLSKIVHDLAGSTVPLQPEQGE